MRKPEARTDKRLAQERRWAAANKPKIWAKQIRVRYKISLVAWLALFYSQGERCAICKTTERGRRQWVTDHDHTTKRVRGILCNRCNTHLGWLGDNAASARAHVDLIANYMK